jgi:hypothetical protein
MICRIHTKKRHPSICKWCRADTSSGLKLAPSELARQKLSKRGRIAAQLQRLQQLSFALGDEPSSDEKPVVRVTAEPPPEPIHRRARPRHRALVLALLLLGVLLGLPTPAEAGYCAAWGVRRICQSGDGDVFTAIVGGSCLRRTYCRYWVRDDEPRVYGYVRRDRDEERWERRDPGSERGVRCKDETVRVVGGAHLTKEGAINDAIRQWQSTVRYDYGERFMDAENARGYRWRCDRASTNESTVGKIGEALGGGGGFQKRCVVLARPCMMPVARGDKDEREDR